MTKESTWELTPARQVMNVPVIFQTGSPAYLTGGVDKIKKKATVLPHVHFVYTCTHAHVCTHTIPITKRMPGSLNREKSSTSLRVWVEASFDRSGTICEMFYLPASLFLSFTPQPSRNRTLCIQASI